MSFPIKSYDCFHFFLLPCITTTLKAIAMTYGHFAFSISVFKSLWAEFSRFLLNAGILEQIRSNSYTETNESAKWLGH